jgi:hypothetical protein
MGDSLMKDHYPVVERVRRFPAIIGFSAGAGLGRRALWSPGCGP